jgi:hypothetical protein
MEFKLFDICNDCGMTTADWVIHGVVAAFVVALVWLRRWQIL